MQTKEKKTSFSHFKTNKNSDNGKTRIGYFWKYSGIKQFALTNIFEKTQLVQVYFMTRESFED